MPNVTKLLQQKDVDFKRYTGIQKATFVQMLDAMQDHEAPKTKSGRPSDLSLEAQILLALTYWREYRTLYHIVMDFSIHESSASRIVKKVEEVLINSGKFDLPRKLPHGKPEDLNRSLGIIYWEYNQEIWEKKTVSEYSITDLRVDDGPTYKVLYCSKTPYPANALPRETTVLALASPDRVAALVKMGA
ncbi:MAG: transposase family protein, partial [Moraxellaceae bacterium]